MPTKDITTSKLRNISGLNGLKISACGVKYRAAHAAMNLSVLKKLAIFFDIYLSQGCQKDAELMEKLEMIVNQCMINTSA